MTRPEGESIMPFYHWIGGFLLLVGMASVHAQPQQAPTPVVEFESVLDTPFFDQSGIVRFDAYVVAFSPEAAFQGEVVVLGTDKQPMARFPFFTEYKAREGVFGKVQVQGPAEVQLSKSGIYNLVFLVDGKPVTRLPFAVEVKSGDDPFNPQQTYRFTGLWNQFAHLTMNTFKDQQVPQVNLWVGGNDLPAGAAKDMFFASLYRDGTLVAHSRKTQGHIAAGHYKRTSIPLHQPHDDKEPDPGLFTLADWQADGQYELRITRSSDGAPLRTFRYTAADGRIQPMPKTEMNYDPRLDYIAPRVVKKGTNVFEMTEAIWLDGLTQAEAPGGSTP
jgi:hypothetical protein